MLLDIPEMNGNGASEARVRVKNDGLKSSSEDHVDHNNNMLVAFQHATGEGES